VGRAPGGVFVGFDMFVVSCRGANPEVATLEAPSDDVN
jgi:hypothetical protein